MKFNERMNKLLDQGKTASMGLAAKAGAKAQNLGERGVLAVEIKQLENQAQKLIGRLGVEAYQAFVERGESTVSTESTPIKTILSEIAVVRESIEKKEAEVKARKGSEGKK